MLRSRYQRSLAPERVLRTYAGAATLVMMLLLAVYGAIPRLRHLLADEYRVIEALSALLYLSAAVIGFRAVRAAGYRPRTHLVVPVAATLGALEEMNFGERLLGLEMPTVAGVKVGPSTTCSRSSWRPSGRVWP